ncbi:MAG: hypothetical protein IAE80_04150, partial [Anaerolinea sp.]|nr:hypothetical protein [Anaerolinea sp.]
MSNQPSTSSSNVSDHAGAARVISSPPKKATAELEIVPVPATSQAASGSTETERASGFAKMREVTSHRPRTLRMQYRFARVVLYFGWLFVQAVFWYILVQRYFPDYVKRTNLERWRGYAR